jgi:tRNA threonylcarbamoyladenosine biosynthesis protein TsaE
LRRIITHSVTETEEVGRRLASRLDAGDVVAFFGGLGMGKTAFIRGMAQGLEVTDHVSSPTFALVHEYRGRLPLYHFDMYRVSSWEDLYSTGFFEYLEAGGICAVEWSENIEEALPENAVRVGISGGGTDESENDDTRVITIKGKCSNENTRG